MLQLSYSTNGLLSLDLFAAIEAVQQAGYAGVELSFDKKQFNPFEMDQRDIRSLRHFLARCGIKPACIATPTITFLADRPHEPSMICLDRAGRKQRIDLVRKGIEIAKALGAPIVSFGSGFIRDEHVNRPNINPYEILAESVNECLKDIGDVTLVIEPEPGMLIETLDQAIAFIESVASPNFRLHMDLCHVYCSETDYAGSISKATPYTKYLHVSDTEEGCNLKLVAYSPDMKMNFGFANYLIYFPETCDFLFLSQDRAIFFYETRPCAELAAIIDNIISDNNVGSVQQIYYHDLHRTSSHLDREINTYAVSVPGLSFYVLDRAKPILKYLRTSNPKEGNQIILKRKIANSLTDKVHYHDIPGRGKIDFANTFGILEKNGFSGYATVELYHHVDAWQKALHESISFLSTKLGQGEISE